MDINTHELQAHQTLALQLRRGDRLTLRHGRLRVSAPPRSLGDGLVEYQPHERWHEGHSIEVGEAGLWQWHALTGATLLLERRQPLWQRLLVQALQVLRFRRQPSSRMQST